MQISTQVAPFRCVRCAMPEFASVEQIRRHFPALARTHNGHPVAYFDGPGGTQVPRRVVAAMTEYLLQHHANTDTWRALAKERGLEVRTVRMRPEDGRLDQEDVARKLTPGTRLLAVGAASNALGTINDVAQLVRQAHAVGALEFVDGVHYSSHHMADVRAWNCDFFVCSAYKFYGPHVGVLWGRGELLEKMDAPRLEPAPAQAPERLETGTLNHEGIVGAAAAVDFLASLSQAQVPRRERLGRVSQCLRQRGTELLRRLWEGLRAIPGVELYGLPPGGERTPTVSFT